MTFWGNKEVALLLFVAAVASLLLNSGEMFSSKDMWTGDGFKLMRLSSYIASEGVLVPSFDSSPTPALWLKDPYLGWPGFQLVVVAFGLLSGLEWVDAYRVLFAFSLLIFPILGYWLALKITGRRDCAVWGAVFGVSSPLIMHHLAPHGLGIMLNFVLLGLAFTALQGSLRDFFLLGFFSLFLVATHHESGLIFLIALSAVVFSRRLAGEETLWLKGFAASFVAAYMAWWFTFGKSMAGALLAQFAFLPAGFSGAVFSGLSLQFVFGGALAFGALAFVMLFLAEQVLLRAKFALEWVLSAVANRAFEFSVFAAGASVFVVLAFSHSESKWVYWPFVAFAAAFPPALKILLRENRRAAFFGVFGSVAFLSFAAFTFFVLKNAVTGLEFVRFLTAASLFMAPVASVFLASAFERLFLRTRLFWPAAFAFFLAWLAISSGGLLAVFFSPGLFVEAGVSPIGWLESRSGTESRVASDIQYYYAFTFYDVGTVAKRYADAAIGSLGQSRDYGVSQSLLHDGMRSLRSDGSPMPDDAVLRHDGCESCAKVYSNNATSVYLYR